MSCAVIDQAIRPDEKSASPQWPTYDQILKENYKGPKARVVVFHFVDQSARGQETSQAGAGISEMLSHAMLSTHRYIIQVRKVSEDVMRVQEAGNRDRIKLEDPVDLIVEGIIKEFKHGIAGAGGGTGGTSVVTLVVTVTHPRTNQVLATERVRGKASEVEGPLGRAGGGLPEIFKYFTKTPMEKAIRMAIEEAASFIVAKTPPDSYRVFPITPPKETPKPPPAKVHPDVPTPSQPPELPPKPVLPRAQIVWDQVNLREGPGTNYKIVGVLTKGTALAIVETRGNWLRVRLGNGNEAWVSRLSTSEATETAVPPALPAPPSPKLSPM